ncbi:MAG: hypothetical protein ACTS44_00205 [Candidatus Hodgkinia cicadicola]
MLLKTFDWASKTALDAKFSDAIKPKVELCRINSFFSICAINGSVCVKLKLKLFEFTIPTRSVCYVGGIKFIGSI